MARSPAVEHKNACRYVGLGIGCYSQKISIWIFYDNRLLILMNIKPICRGRYSPDEDWEVRDIACREHAAWGKRNGIGSLLNTNLFMLIFIIYNKNWSVWSECTLLVRVSTVSRDCTVSHRLKLGETHFVWEYVTLPFQATVDDLVVCSVAGSCVYVGDRVVDVCMIAWTAIVYAQSAYILSPNWQQGFANLCVHLDSLKLFLCRM